MQYLAVTLLIAGIAASVVATGVGEHVTAGIGNAICRVTAEDCKTAAAPRAAVPKPPEVASPKPDEGAGSGLGAAWNRPYRRADPEGGRPPNFSDWETAMTAERAWFLHQGGRIEFREGGGNTFDLTNKIVYLDTTTNKFEQAASWTKAVEAFGGVVEPPPYVSPEDSPSRDEYIKTTLENSAQPDYQRARLTREIRDFGDPNYRNLGVWRQDEYDWAYNKAVAEAERAQVVNRPLSEAEKRRIGDRAGRAAIYEYHKRDSDRNGQTWERYHPRSWRCLWLSHCGKVDMHQK
ncbi:hypothetical protein [Actinomadura sp. HBU206391]|uniref:hypothetical protein n=1 Tax=Actinomadura sp. HBU206391 TaxID=2731692 RepID=UPI00164F87D8|nr:hypothetical protein [Actinomadura sp. HBU206391]MBC6459713.1 hypothetical protein [Actinomadura sp. HBU206391]